MDTTYLEIRSAHGHVWLEERKRKTGMAASSTICNVERSRTSESQFACMQILARPHEHKNARWRLKRVILSDWVNRRACSIVLLQLEGETDGWKEGKAQDTRNRSSCLSYAYIDITFSRKCTATELYNLYKWERSFQKDPIKVVSLSSQ